MRDVLPLAVAFTGRPPTFAHRRGPRRARRGDRHDPEADRSRCDAVDEATCSACAACCSKPGMVDLPAQHRREGGPATRQARLARRRRAGDPPDAARLSRRAGHGAATQDHRQAHQRPGDLRRVHLRPRPRAALDRRSRTPPHRSVPRLDRDAHRSRQPRPDPDRRRPRPRPCRDHACAASSTTSPPGAGPTPPATADVRRRHPPPARHAATRAAARHRHRGHGRRRPRWRTASPESASPCCATPGCASASCSTSSSATSSTTAPTAPGCASRSASSTTNAPSPSTTPPSKRSTNGSPTVPPQRARPHPVTAISPTSCSSSGAAGSARPGSRRGLRDAVNAAGLTGADGRPLRVVAHQLRHTWATELANAGMSMQALMTLLGHRSPEMTIRYARLASPTLKAAYDQAVGKIARRIPVAPPAGRPCRTGSSGWPRRCSRPASPTATAHATRRRGLPLRQHLRDLPQLRHHCRVRPRDRRAARRHPPASRRRRRRGWTSETARHRRVITSLEGHLRRLSAAPAIGASA